MRTQQSVCTSIYGVLGVERTARKYVDLGHFAGVPTPVVHAGPPPRAWCLLLCCSFCELFFKKTHPHTHWAGPSPD